MEERKLLEELMKNSAFREAFRQLLVQDTYLAKELGMEKQESMVYVWCVELTNMIDGEKYYHPIVVPKENGIFPDFKKMMDPLYYEMMYSRNQFTAYDYDAKIDFIKSMNPEKSIRMIAMPLSAFISLRNALNTLVLQILSEVEQCFVHYDTIATYTHMNMDAQKAMLLASVFGNMTIVASCINQNMHVIDSVDHAYPSPEPFESEYSGNYSEDDEEDFDPQTYVPF